MPDALDGFEPCKIRILTAAHCTCPQVVVVANGDVHALNPENIGEPCPRHGTGSEVLPEAIRSVEIDGYCYRGLALHLPYDPHECIGAGLTVTHVASGLAVLSIPNASTAYLGIVRDLADAAPWDLAREELLLACPDIASAVKAAQDALEAHNA